MPQKLSNNRRIAKNTMIMYGRMLIMMFISLYTSRIVFNALGINDFGLYNVVGGIIVFFTFINGGLANATRRYITAELANGDEDTQRNVFNLSILSHIIIAGVILLLAETIGLYIVNTYLNIPPGRMTAANIVYQLSVISAVFSVMQTPFSVTIVAYEKMSIYAYFTILDSIFKLLTAYILTIYLGDTLILYAFLIFGISVINIIIYRIYCYRKFSICRWKRPHNKILLKEMFGFMGWNLTGQAAIVATNQGVSFLINIFYNVAVNAAIGVSNSIVGIVNGFVSNFQIAFNPQIIKLYVTNEYDELVILAQRCTRLTSFLMLIFIIPISFEVKDLLTLWLGDYPQYAPEFCVLTLIAIYFDNLAGPMWMIRNAHKNIKQYQIIVSIIYSMCFWGGWLTLAIGWVPYSVIGVRILVFAFLFFVRVYAVKLLIPKLSISNYVYEVIFKSLLIIIVPIAGMTYFSNIDFGGLFSNIIIKCLVGFALTCLSISIIGLSKTERNYMFAYIKGKILQ